MPGVTARSASKNMSKSKRAAAAKNSMRVAAAINDELELCTYGKIIRACGNKMFIIATPENKQHLAHIRGKMARLAINDIVLLSVREYESRANTAEAVFDIMALFSKKDINRLVKNGTIPSSMISFNSKDDTGLDDIFDYSDVESEDEDGVYVKHDKKIVESNHSDSDIDISTI
jgi:translation initiation factor IF-1